MTSTFQMRRTTDPDRNPDGFPDSDILTVGWLLEYIGAPTANIPGIGG